MVQHVVVRKRIQFSVILYLLLLLTGVPTFLYYSILYLRYEHELYQVRRMIDRGDLNQAELKLNKTLKDFFWSDRALAIDLKLQTQFGLAQDDPSRWRAVLFDSARLQGNWLAPRDLDWYRGFAYFHLGPNLYEKSLSAFSHHLNRHEADTNLLVTIYQMQRDLKKYPNALSTAEKLIKLDPKNLTYRFKKVLIYYESGEKLKAQEELRDLVFSQQDGPETRLMAKILLSLLREFKLTEESDFVYNYLLQKTSRDLEWVIAYGWFLYENQQLPKARALVWTTLLSNQNSLELRKLYSRLF